MVATPLYRLVSVDRAGNYLTDLPYADVQGDFFMNKPKQLRWNMPMDHPQVKLSSKLFPGLTEVQLLRGTKQVFRGPLWDMTGSSQKGKVSCSAESVEGYFDVMHINYEVDVTGPQAHNVWGIIETLQAETNGDYGITLGTLAGSGTTRRTTVHPTDGKYVSDILNDYTSLDDGFDYEVDMQTRAFRTWAYRRDSGEDNVRVLEFGRNASGATAGTIRNYSIHYQGKYQRSHVWAIGPDDRYAVAFNGSAGTYNKRTWVGSYKDAPNQGALKAWADQQALLRKGYKLTPAVVVDGSRINPFTDGRMDYGQRVKLYINDSFHSINGQVFRLFGWQFSLSKNDMETFVLYLEDLRELGE